MTPEQRMHIDEWIGALRSGEYDQARGRLARANGYCCLGVLCEVAGFEKYETTKGFSYHPYGSSFRWATKPTEAWFDLYTGLGPEIMNILMMRNDSGSDFGEIADYIKKVANDDT